MKKKSTRVWKETHDQCRSRTLIFSSDCQTLTRDYKYLLNSKNTLLDKRKKPTSYTEFLSRGQLLQGFRELNFPLKKRLVPSFIVGILMKHAHRLAHKSDFLGHVGQNVSREAGMDNLEQADKMRNSLHWVIFFQTPNLIIFKD